MEKFEVKKRMFKIIAKPGSEYILIEDFKPIMR
jgi:hypothetical protein